MSFPPRPDAAATGSLPGQGFVLAPDEGDPWWWLDSLNLVKLPGSATSGGLDIVEHRVPAGYAPPPHVHARQDEVFYILDGQFTVRCGERTWQAGAGSLVFLPRGVPHGFVVSGDAPGRTPADQLPGRVRRGRPRARRAGDRAGAARAGRAGAGPRAHRRSCRRPRHHPASGSVAAYDPVMTAQALRYR